MANLAGLLALCLASQVELPGTSSISDAIAPASACRSCHGNFDPAESAYDTWAGSPMAHAARNPLFLSALTEAEKDLPGVGDFCLRCHAPAAWLDGRCVPTDGSGLLADDGGVDCAFCHRLDRSSWQRNGQYLVGEDTVYRGPYPPMALHAAQQSDFISSSELCGSCHDLRNPLVDRVDLQGAPMGMPFPEQTTYTEWASSSVTETCQDCHMPETVGPVAENFGDRPDRSRHSFLGGNLFLLNAIDFLEPGLGLGAQLDRAKVRAEAMLARAAALEITADDAVDRGRPTTLAFRITNETGHKLPTGYPEGRRVWLEVTSPQLALRRGRFDETTGAPVDPVALYEAVQGQSGIGPGHRLALNDTIFFDNRIPPEGFVVTTTTAPVGYSYPEVAPGVLAHWDDVVLTATAPCDLGVDRISVTARLWYQSVTREYVEALVAENGNDPRAFRLSAAFEEADPGPTLMLERSIEIALESTCEPPDAGQPTDTGLSDAGTPEDSGAVDAGVITPPPEEEEGCGCSASRSGADDGLGALGLVLLMLGFGLIRNRWSFS